MSRSLSFPQTMSRECQALWSYVRAEPIRALLTLIFLSSGSLKLLAPQPLQATFQHGHPLWLYRSSGLMEVGAARALMRQQPKQASTLSYTFLGGVLYTVAAFPQTLPTVVTHSPILAPVARAGTFLPALATVALTARYQKISAVTGIADDGNDYEAVKWTRSDWGREVAQPMLLCLTAGALGGHAFRMN